ncbi:hypothetical protein HPP92_003865 [Vanilla planifolia]|uniref:Uncharacterized protein n=1 Tax=Vanilla planifolia TaxID=51239 RepID=A0A835SHI9_VANPL|nr:hypothetical protein HPP92_003865 [Vanilla planifolia]
MPLGLQLISPKRFSSGKLACFSWAVRRPHLVASLAVFSIAAAMNTHILQPYIEKREREIEIEKDRERERESLLWLGLHHAEAAEERSEEGGQRRKRSERRGAAFGRAFSHLSSSSVFPFSHERLRAAGYLKAAFNSCNPNQTNPVNYGIISPCRIKIDSLPNWFIA